MSKKYVLQSVLDGLTPTWVKLDEDKDDENAPEFELRPLNGPELLHVESKLEVRGDVVVSSPEGIEYAARRALSNWRGIKDSKGNEIPFDKRKAIDMLDSTVITELGRKAYSMSRLSEDEIKNS